MSGDHVRRFLGETEINPKNECWWGVVKQGAVGHGKWNGGHSFDVAFTRTIVNQSLGHSTVGRLS